MRSKQAIAKEFAPIFLPVARLPGDRDRPFSVSEVAELLSVSDATVYALCAGGIRYVAYPAPNRRRDCPHPAAPLSSFEIPAELATTPDHARRAT